MANTIDTVERLDGESKYVVDIYIEGDGSGDETDTALITFSNVNNPHNYTDLSLEKYIANFNDFNATLIWDATTNVPFQHIPVGDSGFDYTVAGGPKNNTAGAGKTGSVLITTSGLTGLSKGTLRLEFRKHGGSRAL